MVPWWFIICMWSQAFRLGLNSVSRIGWNWVCKSSLGPSGHPCKVRLHWSMTMLCMLMVGHEHCHQQVLQGGAPSGCLYMHVSYWAFKRLGRINILHVRWAQTRKESHSRTVICRWRMDWPCFPMSHLASYNKQIVRMYEMPSRPPRFWGPDVTTWFCNLNMVFPTNGGTPHDYSSLHQIHVVISYCCPLFPTHRELRCAHRWQVCFFWAARPCASVRHESFGVVRTVDWDEGVSWKMWRKQWKRWPTRLKMPWCMCLGRCWISLADHHRWPK